MHIYIYYTSISKQLFGVFPGSVKSRAFRDPGGGPGRPGRPGVVDGAGRRGRGGRDCGGRGSGVQRGVQAGQMSHGRVIRVEYMSCNNSRSYRCHFGV